MLEIDGSELLGGGQILRVALALSAVMGQPFRIRNIRAGRTKPGLQPQHLTGVRAAAEITGGKVEGERIGATELSFVPSAVSLGDYLFDVGTAGSITLLAQSLVPALAITPGDSSLVLKGGTHVEWSPTVDYYENVFLPIVRKFGADIEIEILRYGWYPKGGGEVRFDIRGGHLKGCDIAERGAPKGMEGICAASNLREDIVEREMKAIRFKLPEANLRSSIKPAASPGTAVTLWATFDQTVLGAESRGKLGKPAEEVGREAAERLEAEISHGAALDSHMTDQVLIFMALAKGRSSVTVPELTPHAKTCIAIIPRFTNIPFEVKKEGKIYRISVEGIG